LKAEAAGKVVRVVYVQDRESGIKLFADKAWYIRDGGELSAFGSKAGADDWATKHAGKEMSYGEVRNSLMGAVAKTE
jgi:NitT/TauT family transport system substrate-binding protein